MSPVQTMKMIHANQSTSLQNFRAVRTKRRLEALAETSTWLTDKEIKNQNDIIIKKIIKGTTLEKTKQNKKSEHQTSLPQSQKLEDSEVMLSKFQEEIISMLESYPWPEKSTKREGRTKTWQDGQDFKKLSTGRNYSKAAT